MNGLLLTSKEEKMPIELMYMSEDGKITYRRVIVTSWSCFFIHNTESSRSTEGRWICNLGRRKA
jgi:hypothetical protein